MVSPAHVRESLTLDEFLRLPEEEPPLEYIDGRIETEISPRMRQSVIELELTLSMNRFAEPGGLGEAFHELRCTFAGRSIVPDVAFLVDAHIETDERGQYSDETPFPPDIHVEIVSPEHSLSRSREKLVHSTVNGCSLGWLIHLEEKWVEVFRPRQPANRLTTNGVLEGDPVLPGFRLEIAELFGWLVYRKPGSTRMPPALGNEPA